MFRSLITILLASLFLLLPDAVQAAVITIDGTIKSVDLKKRTITVQTKTKTLELDVSRKAKVSVKGKTTKLDSLTPGQKVKISYHEGLEIVLKIEAASYTEDEKKEKSLFNGRTLAGWRFHSPRKLRLKVSDCWVVDGERQVLNCLGNKFNWIETELKYGDFTLRLEWRFPPGRRITASGSGVVVRSIRGNDPNRSVPVGIETQIATGTSGDFWAIETPLRTDRPSPRRTNLFSKKISAEKPIGKWNTLEIHCVRDRIAATLNGVLVNEGRGIRKEAGTICLLSQNSPIEFRNIRIVPLPSSTKSN